MYLVQKGSHTYHVIIAIQHSRALPATEPARSHSSCSSKLVHCESRPTSVRVTLPTRIRVWLMGALGWVDGLFVAERKLFQYISSRQRNLACFRVINKLFFIIVRDAFIWKLKWIARCRWRGCWNEWRNLANITRESHFSTASLIFRYL